MRLTRAQHAAALHTLPPEGVAAYLTAHSDLPGPRANLELMAAAADVLPAAVALPLAREPDEYLRCCGVVTLGRLVVRARSDAERSRVVELLTTRAADLSWRVREAVATAAQRIGDADPTRFLALVERWVHEADPLVVRAGVAAICEPRLLHDPAVAAAALAACEAATNGLRAVPTAARRNRGVRVLRQGLGYCWSVAVAADPSHGLPVFAGLPLDDPDVAWVVRENRKKKRLRTLLSS